MATKKQRKHVRRVFDDVLTTYFSRWAAGSSWRIRVETQSPYTNEEGRCVPERRMISVNPNFLDRPREELEKLLVHECCHAVTTQEHDEDWFGQMRLALDRAERVGRARVAELLAKEIDIYREVGKREPRGISAIRETIDSILLQHPAESFDDVVRRLCKWECMPRKVLLKQYPGIRSAYRKAKKENDELLAEPPWR